MTTSTEEKIQTLVLVGMSTVEVVAAIHEAMSGLAEILTETIAVAALPEAFAREKIAEIHRLMTESGRVFRSAQLVLGS